MSCMNHEEFLRFEGDVSRIGDVKRIYMLGSEKEKADLFNSKHY